MPDRTVLLRQGLTKEMNVFEVGPSYNPLLPKAEGWNVATIDHLDRAGLIEKYSADPHVDVSRIEDVNFVWQSGALSDAVPKERHGTFDAFIASHVIEHTTDIISFLRSASALIKPSGRIILAAPDKRVCFDFYRPVSMASDAIVANRTAPDKHDAKTHFDYGVYSALKGGGPGWPRSDTQATAFISSIASGFDFMKRAQHDGYIDAHHWVFVPASLELLILELSFLGMLDLRIEKTEIAEATEFFAWLLPGRLDASLADIQTMRRDLLNRIIVELAEQSRQIPGSPLAVAEERLRAVSEALSAPLISSPQ